jgi:hypothetical protein
MLYGRKGTLQEQDREGRLSTTDEMMKWGIERGLDKRPGALPLAFSILIQSPSGNIIFPIEAQEAKRGRGIRT